MPRPLPLLCLCLLCACGEEAPAPPRQAEKSIPKPPAAAPPAASAPSPARIEESGESAASVLRRYYALIEAGRYDQAWRMRSADGAGFAGFAASFRRYRSYRVTVGTPSTPVQSGGWAYVEVPVQIFGTLRSGEPFGTAGSVTMRRSTQPEDDGQWRIYTR